MNLDKKKLQQLIVLIPAVFIAALFMILKYKIKPLQLKRVEIAQELENIKRDYQESKGRAERLPILEQEIMILDQEILDMQRRLPPSQDVPSLIRLLSKRMDFYHINWTRLSPGTAPTVKEYYIEHSYTIPFRATYHDLARFLAEVGQMERIFATRIGALRPGGAVDVNSGTMLITGELTFLIYTAK